VLPEDTFESISRIKYGTEKESSRIAQVNPGVVEPLTAGITLTIPVIPDAPEDVPQQAPTESEDEVALLIDKSRFRFWNSVRIVRAIDRISTIDFGAPFDADAPGFRETFVPNSYKPVDFTIGGEPLFTGTMVLPLPILEESQKIISVSGYSLPGVLNDCTTPASFFTKEFNNQGLNDIATTLSSPFGVGVDMQSDQGAVFERVAINDPFGEEDLQSTDKKVLGFLINLAKQRNLIVGDTALGKLAFRRPVDVGSPQAQLRQGESPVLSVTPSFSPQDYYSHITGIEPVFTGLPGAQYTVVNPHLTGVVRPFTFVVPDSQEGDLKAAVEAKAGRMFGSALSYSVAVNTWRDPQGNLWEPNTTITLVAPDAMVYSEYEFLIRSVEYEVGESKRFAVLNLVVPGSFSGRIPERLPWDV
jgi:prophage tail gpP-like protein